MAKKKAETEALELTSKQSLALDGLLAGDRFEAAAAKAGVHRNTVSRWMRLDPVFIANFRNRRGEIESALDHQVRGLAGDALQVLREELESDDPRIRLAAAREILRQRQQTSVEAEEYVDPLRVAEDMDSKRKHRDLFSDWNLSDTQEALELLESVRGGN